MIKVSRKGVDVKVTYTDEMGKDSAATAFCKNTEAAQELAEEVREAVNLGYGFAKCRAILEGDTIKQHGGYRPGAGRPSTGRRKRTVYVTDTEYNAIKELIEQLRGNE